MQPKQQDDNRVPDEVLEQVVAGTHAMAYRDRREIQGGQKDEREALGKPNQTRINPLYSEEVRP
jgi:hypothetical protein